MRGLTRFAGLLGRGGSQPGLPGRMALIQRRLVQIVIVSVSACSVDAGESTHTLVPGEAIVLPSLSGDRPALVWVFDAMECLGCELTGPAHSVRLLQRRLGARMETAVVALSELRDGDGAMVGDFLEAQRVSAQVTMLTPGEHRRDFGAGPVPAFYILGVGRVAEAVLDPDLADSWRSERDSLSLSDFIEAIDRGNQSTGGGTRK